MELENWQKEAVEKVLGKNAIVSAPTGSGKTIVAYIWAGLFDAELNKTDKIDKKVIFTAPIKSLSNERYMDLKEKGFNVGLETGDFKVNNDDCDILCCTQEIYTNKYAAEPNLKVVVDEFHYVFENSERSRAYINGLLNTNEDSKILVMSATFGSITTIQKYLTSLCNREFEVFTTSDRLTKLFFNGGIAMKQLKDALVFCFSQRGVSILTYRFTQYRRAFRKSDKKRNEKLRSLAQKMKVKFVGDLVWNELEMGIGRYCGAMLPSQKLFIQRAFMENVIDVVVGTDALALGVNLPAKNVVFAQLAKYYDGPISKNSFLQMSGRAGRRNYFDCGYVYYLPDSSVESYDYRIDMLYNKMLKKGQENPVINLTIDYKSLLWGFLNNAWEDMVQREVNLFENFQLPKRNYKEGRIKADIQHEFIELFQSILYSFPEDFCVDEKEEAFFLPKEVTGDEETHIENVQIDKLMQFLTIVEEIYFSEYSLWLNCQIGHYLWKNSKKDNKIKLSRVLEIIENSVRNRNPYEFLCQVKRFYNNRKVRAYVKDDVDLGKQLAKIDPLAAIVNH